MDGRDWENIDNFEGSQASMEDEPQQTEPAEDRQGDLLSENTATATYQEMLKDSFSSVRFLCSD